MNIFQHRSSLYGCPDSGAGKDSLLSLFKLAKQIRLRLGKQGYLLDCYLSLFFDGISAEITTDAVFQGIEAGGKAQKLLLQAMEGTEPEEKHPLNQRIRKAYEQQADALSFQEPSTNLCLLLFPLADEIMFHYTAMFIKKLADSSSGMDDMICFQELYERISDLAGESVMEQLNKQLQQRFLIAPLALAFAQGFTHDLLFKLTSRDPETSRQMFQLLLDSMPDGKEGT